MCHPIVDARNIIKAGCICGLFLMLQCSSAETKPAQLPSLGSAFSNVALGFSYVPPSEMNDETRSGREEIRARAAARHTANTLNLLLSMSNGGDDRDPKWQSLTIETYPRQKFSDLDDLSAEAKMSAWVAGASSLPGKTRSVILAGQKFEVLVFAEQDGTIRKGAVIWTTIRKDKLLSFAFGANSPEQLKRLAESMKSLRFY